MKKPKEKTYWVIKESNGQLAGLTITKVKKQLKEWVNYHVPKGNWKIVKVKLVEV